MRRAIKTIFKIFGASIVVGLVAKIIFLITYFGQTTQLPLSEIMGVFYNGLKLDISTAGYITALPLLLITLGVWGGWLISDKWWRVLIRTYLTLISFVYAIITAVDITLYGYWGYRIDATLLPYLTSPTDAAASVTMGDILLSTVVFVVMMVVSQCLFRLSTRDIGVSKLTVVERVEIDMALLLLGGVLFIAIRGGISEAVANVSKVYFSSNAYANHAAVNPTFSFLSSMGKAKRYDQMYVAYDAPTLKGHFAHFQDGTEGEPVAKPILKSQRPNIAIVIAEGYTYNIMMMEREGHVVMPNLHRLTQEGINFDRTYASGCRTDKGVPSALSGFPAQPKMSIMKVPSKSRNMPSIAKSLAQEGYKSSFYYGGDLNFMDMASYLYGTGWGELIYKSDIKSDSERPRQWGWSDGVMMEYFADKIIEKSSSSQPFLAGLLTLSSHEPFDIPEQAVISDALIDSYRYSDKHLGKMVERLKASKAWDNLLLIIVADHCIGYDGRNIPYNSPTRHHIPMVWCGGAIQNSFNVEQVASQCDLPATLLATLGLDYSDYHFSRNIFSGREYPVFYTFNDGFGMVDEDGYLIYDNIQERVLNDEFDSNLLDIGRAVQQQMHVAIEAL